MTLEGGSRLGSPCIASMLVVRHESFSYVISPSVDCMGSDTGFLSKLLLSC